MGSFQTAQTFLTALEDVKAMVKDLTDLVSGKAHFQAQSWYLIMSP